VKTQIRSPFPFLTQLPDWRKPSRIKHSQATYWKLILLGLCCGYKNILAIHHWTTDNQQMLLMRWSNPNNLPRLKRLVNREHHATLEAVIMAGEALPKIRLHDLRHTAGTLMLRRGMRVEVVSKILGHAKVSITLEVYRHVLESEKRTEMIDLFDRPLPKPCANSSSSFCALKLAHENPVSHERRTNPKKPLHFCAVVKKTPFNTGFSLGSEGRDRTYDQSVNSRSLYR
jgi:hypothetical protein